MLLLLISPLALMLTMSSDGAEVKTLLSLFVIFTAAKLAAELFERLHQPAVVGEILAGVIIGPSVLGWIHPTEVTQVLAEIGVILLLFLVGLEINPTSLFKVGRRALLIAISGVILPFLGGWGLMWGLGYTQVESAFIGAALVATSVGITARVLGAMKVLNAQASQMILGAAVIDDILALLVLSGVSSFAQGKVQLLDLAVSAGISIGFTLFVLFFGSRLMRKAQPGIEQLQVGETYFVVGMILCLGLSLAGAVVGVAAIIGAFLAGMALSETAEETHLHQQAGAVMEFTVPFFLVGIGLQLNIQVFSQLSVLILAIVLTLIAIVTKLVGCGLAALPGNGVRTSLQVGMGMVPRGEVGIIVAQIGLSLGVLSASLYGIVVFMAVMTTLVAPPFLTRLFASEIRSEAARLDERVIEEDRLFSEIQ